MIGTREPRRRAYLTEWGRWLSLAALVVVTSAVACSSNGGNDDGNPGGGSACRGDDDGDAGGAGGNACFSNDNDGICGGTNTILVSVSDTGFSVGGVDSGSMEPNIAVENLSNVALTLTNVGTRPHDMVVECIPSGLPPQCPRMSCFNNPDGAMATGPVTLVPTLQPGQSMTVTFATPAVEGAYPFLSDVPGDATSYDPADGGVTGNLVGEFVLM